MYQKSCDIIFQNKFDKEQLEDYCENLKNVDISKVQLYQNDDQVLIGGDDIQIQMNTQQKNQKQSGQDNNNKNKNDEELKRLINPRQLKQQKKMKIMEQMKQDLDTIDQQVENWPSVFQIIFAKPNLGWCGYLIILGILLLILIPPTTIIVTFFRKNSCPDYCEHEETITTICQECQDFCPQKGGVEQKLCAFTLFLVLELTLYFQIVGNLPQKKIITKNLMFYNDLKQFDQIYEYFLVIVVLNVTYILFITNSDLQSLLLNSLAAVFLTQFDETFGNIVSKRILNLTLQKYLSRQWALVSSYLNVFEQFIDKGHTQKIDEDPKIVKSLDQYKLDDFVQKLVIEEFKTSFKKKKIINSEFMITNYPKNYKKKNPQKDVPSTPQFGQTQDIYYDFFYLAKYQWHNIKNDLIILFKLSLIPKFNHVCMTNDKFKNNYEISQFFIIRLIEHYEKEIAKYQKCYKNGWQPEMKGKIQKYEFEGRDKSKVLELIENALIAKPSINRMNSIEDFKHLMRIFSLEKLWKKNQNQALQNVPMKNKSDPQQKATWCQNCFNKYSECQQSIKSCLKHCCNSTEDTIYKLKEKTTNFVLIVIRITYYLAALFYLIVTTICI